MKKQLLYCGTLYLILYGLNNLVYMNHPQYQQHPLEVISYVRPNPIPRWQLLPASEKYMQQVKEAITNDSLAVVELAIVKARKEQQAKEAKYNARVGAFQSQMAAIENPDKKYFEANRSGYMGKYQMGRAAFRTVGYRINASEFRDNPLSERAQDKAFLKFCLANRESLSKDIQRYSGKTINGIEVHESNIIAAAHAGEGRARAWLRSHGEVDIRDGNGTRISHYFRLFENKRVNWKKVELKVH